MNHRSGQRGFTIIELLVVMGIIIILSAVGFFTLSRYRGNTDLSNATRSAASFLREAQSKSIAQASSSVWGVHFENATTTSPFFALFYSTYSTSTRFSYYRLPPAVVYATSTLGVGSSTEITFSALTGAASASTTISFQYLPSGGVVGTSSVSVNNLGAVSFITR